MRITIEMIRKANENLIKESYKKAKQNLKLC